MRTFVVALALAAVAVGTVDAAPAVVVPAEGFVPVSNSSCLTPAQEKQLKEAVGVISTLFRTAIIALDIAEKAEKDPTTKANIEIAIKVLLAVETDIVKNLTSIVESACPTCSNITAVIERSVNVIEETLNKIDPNWQHNPIYEDVFKLVQTLLDIVHALCPTAAAKPALAAARVAAVGGPPM